MISTRNLIALCFAVVVLAVFSAISFWNWRVNAKHQHGGRERPLEGLQAFGTVPEFSLVERDGRRISLSDLKGKVSIVNFIYTNCPDTCPIQSAQMKQIQDDFKNEKDTQFVSITVDPDRDTPQVLSQYAKRFGADPTRWLFITGEKQPIYKLAQDGFHLGAVEIPHDKRSKPGATYTHSPRFVLIDREAQIRGYYVSTDPDAMNRLRRDLKILIRGGSSH